MWNSLTILYAACKSFVEEGIGVERGVDWYEVRDSNTAHSTLLLPL